MQAEIWYILSLYNYDSGVFKCTSQDKKVEVYLNESHFHVRVDHPRGAYFSCYTYSDDGFLNLIKYLAAKDS